MNILNFLKRKLGLLLAISLLAGTSVVLASDTADEGEAPEGGASGPITPGAGWTCTADTPPEFFFEGAAPVFASDGPFTFEGNFCVFVTDSLNEGDAFTIYDNGSPVGSTPLVAAGESGVCDPDVNFADPAWSSGVFQVGAGSHSITIEVIANPGGDPSSGFIKVEECPLGTGESRATFPVDKNFDDDNPTEVEVTISCNTGLPLEQSSMISEGDGVVFVVTDFSDAELDCEIFENPVPAGYLPEYFENGVFAGDESCTFEDIRFGDAHSCLIEDNLQQVTFEVTKEWIDENPQFDPVNFAEANYNCSGEQFSEAFGQLSFLGNPGTDSFGVFPHWDGGTTCTVTETVVDSGVETDSSDCQSVSVTPGNDASCTIVNTRLFEGIPTLSQYGLTLMVLLMLGMGFVAYRRIV